MKNILIILFLHALVFADNYKVAFVLRGYDNNPMFTSTSQFENEARKSCDILSKLSFGSFTYDIYDAGTDVRAPFFMASLREIEVLEAALDNWSSPEWDWVKNLKPIWLKPTVAQRTIIQDAIDWMKANKLTTQQWSSQTEQGRKHFNELQANVIRFSSSASADYLKGMKLPDQLNIDDYDTINIILHSNTDYSLAGASSSLRNLGVTDSEKKAAYIGYNPSIVSADKGFGIIVHETIHSFGMGTHDEDPDQIYPNYSVMNDAANFDTFPAFDRVHWVGWLPRTTITTNPALVSDLKDATDRNAKYILKVGQRRYQELYNGKWIQYRTDQFGTITFEAVDNALRQKRKVKVSNKFKKGWTLLSLPFRTVLKEKVFVWNNKERYYERATEIKENHAYWKFSKKATSKSYEGDVAQSPALNLKVGWNMLGVGMEVNTDGKNIYGWDGNNYYKPNVLKPGEGYWIFSFENNTLTFD